MESAPQTNTANVLTAGKAKIAQRNLAQKRVLPLFDAARTNVVETVYVKVVNVCATKGLLALRAAARLVPMSAITMDDVTKASVNVTMTMKVKIAAERPAQKSALATVSVRSI
jgi:hypothetical protein